VTLFLSHPSFINIELCLLNIEGQNSIEGIHENYYVAPAVLQLLVENAIKHNVISKKLPLQITFCVENGYLVVINNLQEKPVKEDSLQIGLKNIMSRYEFLSNKPVEISRDNESFKVKVPLLEVQEI
jgi:two-component system, LytTR family, sensor kinase